MRVSIEATAACCSKRGGVARYTESLVGALLRGNQADDRYELCYRVSRWKQREHVIDAPVTKRWVFGPMWHFRPPVDVVHGTDARVPVWRTAARVATLHDVFSLMFEGFASERFRSKKLDRYQRLTKACDRIIAVSEVTKADFLRFFEFPEERIDVVHEGVDASFHPRSVDELDRVRARHRLNGPYLLYVGELSRRKNLPNLIAAYGRSKLSEDTELILVGTPSFGADEVELSIRENGLEGRVRLLGYAPEADLPALYSGAEAFVFPTCYEGFGLPILEAMACGIPVLAGNRGAVREVANGHAVLVDPDSIEAIADGIERVVDVDPERVQAALMHSKRFTWDACAEKTRAVYAHALAARCSESTRQRIARLASFT